MKKHWTSTKWICPVCGYSNCKCWENKKNEKEEMSEDIGEEDSMDSEEEIMVNIFHQWCQENREKLCERYPKLRNKTFPGDTVTDDDEWEPVPPQALKKQKNETK